MKTLTVASHTADTMLEIDCVAILNRYITLHTNHQLLETLRSKASSNKFHV